MDKHHAAWLERHADRDGPWLKPCRMSVFGGKADVRELPSGCLLIARSGHGSMSE